MHICQSVVQFPQNFCDSKFSTFTDFHMYEYRKKGINYLTYIVRKGESIVGKGDAVFVCFFRKGQAVCDQIQEEKGITRIAG